MKILSVGDLHGNDVWKEIDPDLWDKIIFVGDYTDSFHLPDIDILNNLLDLIAFGKAYPDKVVTLLGNHDVDNYINTRAGASGYRSSMFSALHSIFKENKEHFKVAHQIDVGDDHYLWTHAGVHTGWYYNSFLPSIKGIQDLEELTLAELLNDQYEDENRSLFDIGRLRGGYHQVGGPFWVDKRLSSQKPLQFYHQIVGHTRGTKVETFDYDVYTSITFIDCLENITPAEYYELEI